MTVCKTAVRQPPVKGRAYKKADIIPNLEGGEHDTAAPAGFLRKEQ